MERQPSARQRELLRCVEAEQFDHLSEAVGPDEFADDFFAYYEARDRWEADEEIPGEWANWYVHSAPSGLKRRLVECLAGRASDEALGYLGAGPIEDLLAGGDEEIVAWVERCCAGSDRFRRAISSIYVWGDLPNEACVRLERAAGVRLPRPIGWTGP